MKLFSFSFERKLTYQICATSFIKVSVFEILSLECENSRHKERVKNFVKKYSHSKRKCVRRNHNSRHKKFGISICLLLKGSRNGEYIRS